MELVNRGEKLLYGKINIFMFISKQHGASAINKYSVLFLKKNQDGMFLCS